MELSKFCPICGKEAESFYGDGKKMCGECFLERNRLLDIPDEASIEICEECDQMKQDGKWHERFTDEDRINLFFSRFRDENTDIEYEIGKQGENLKVDYTVSKDGLEDSGNILIEFSEATCRDCEGFEGAFTKSKIQIRGRDTEEISDLIDKRSQNLEEKNHDDFVIDKEEVEGGLDYILSTEHMSRHILDTVTKRFDLEVSRSYQLIGKQDEKDLYRNTVVLRRK